MGFQTGRHLDDSETRSWHGRRKQSSTETLRIQKSWPQDCGGHRGLQVKVSLGDVPGFTLLGAGAMSLFPSGVRLLEGAEERPATWECTRKISGNLPHSPRVLCRQGSWWLVEGAVRLWMGLDCWEMEMGVMNMVDTEHVSVRMMWCPAWDRCGGRCLTFLNLVVPNTRQTDYLKHSSSAVPGR